jgi:hypothetical protein
MTRALGILASLVVLALAGCAPQEQVGYAAQVGDVSRAAVRVEAGAPPACVRRGVVGVCFCPQVCAPARSVGRYWLFDPAECACAAT